MVLPPVLKTGRPKGPGSIPTPSATVSSFSQVGRCPVTAETRVQISLGPLHCFNDPVVNLVEQYTPTRECWILLLCACTYAVYKRIELFLRQTDT